MKHLHFDNPVETLFSSFLNFGLELSLFWYFHSPSTSLMFVDAYVQIFSLLLTELKK